MVKKGQYNYIEGKEITKWESLKEIIEKDKYISIFGDENSGKTTLAKYIAYNLLKKNTVLYITSEDINGKHIGKTIKNVFEDQYSSESLTFAKFNQIEKKYKVAIVDDIHKIKYSDLTMLVEFLKEDFGYILLTSKNKIEFDISDEAKQKILGDEFIEYNISPFYSEKRVQLIEKVANVLNVKKSNDVAQSINNFIKVQLKVFKTDPSFIIKYVRYFLLKAEGTTNKQDVFNEVFESNIIQSIQNSKAREPISKVMKILEEIAYYIHINKQYPIDYDDINRVIKSYNEDYDFTVNTTYLVESLETGRILKKVSGDNKYYFTDTNYLAFFVARKIYAEYSNTGKTIEIEKALNTLCVSIVVSDR